MAGLKTKKANPTLTVPRYIASCPKNVQVTLRKVRAAIRSAAPGAKERTDYFNWPGYSYPGFDYDGMFAWFSYKQPSIRLHVRPPVIDDHKNQLRGYILTKAVVSFPDDRPIPLALVKKLVKASVAVMRKKAPTPNLGVGEGK